MVSGALLSLWPAAGAAELPLENQLELAASQLDVATRQRAMALEAVSEQVCTGHYHCYTDCNCQVIVCRMSSTAIAAALLFGLVSKVAHI